jgi:hypothetical protein
VIQDASPQRCNCPDAYTFYGKADVVAGPLYTQNTERVPNSAFTITRTGVGVATLGFPAGQKVRGVSAAVDSKLATAAQFDAYVTNINESAGTANLVIDSAGAAALADPATGAVIYWQLELETV